MEEKQIDSIDKMWKLYREFCLACNQAGMVNQAPEFLAWLENYKFRKPAETKCKKVD